MENTQNLLIGLEMKMFNITDVRKYLINIISEYYQINDYSLNIDEELMIMMIVKYGIMIIDIEISNSNIIKILFTTNQAGLDYLEDKDIDLDEFFINWKISFNSLLPLDFIIEDACITDNKDIWLDKYFFV